MIAVNFQILGSVSTAPEDTNGGALIDEEKKDSIVINGNGKDPLVPKSQLFALNDNEIPAELISDGLWDGADAQWSREWEGPTEWLGMNSVLFDVLA